MGRMNTSWVAPTYDTLGGTLNGSAQLDLALVSSVIMSKYEENVVHLRTVGQVLFEPFVLVDASPGTVATVKIRQSFRIYERIYKTIAEGGVDVVHDPEDTGNAKTDILWNRVQTYAYQPGNEGASLLPSTQYLCKSNAAPECNLWASYIDTKVKRRVENEERLYYTAYVEMPADDDAFTFHCRYEVLLRSLIKH